MKKIIQIIIFLIIIILIHFLYINYFKPVAKKTVQSINNENIKISEKKNSTIKNLKYNIKIDKNRQYTITAKLSEITFVDNIELVNMSNVEAKFIDKENNSLIIVSDKATYNDTNYNTVFKKNVKMEYLTNKIFAESLELDFEKNIILISEKVKFDGLNGIIFTDNIKINLITKETELYMNNSNNKIQLITK